MEGVSSLQVFQPVIHGQVNDCCIVGGLVQFGPVWSSLVQFGPVWSSLVQFGPVRSSSVQSGKDSRDVPYLSNWGLLIILEE
jgi:hypothetical protein